MKRHGSPGSPARPQESTAEGGQKINEARRARRAARDARKVQLKTPIRPKPTMLALAKLLEKDPQIVGRTAARRTGFRWKPVRQLLRFRRIERSTALAMATVK